MLAPGQTFDRYVVQRRLGRGGMAEVWRAEHAVLGSPVALKILHGPASPVLHERLLREGRLQATLRHPGIVRVLDVISVDGQTALVLDLVEGPSLQDVVRQGPLPLARVEALLRALGPALAAAHAAKVVHRDLKPANILLDPDGAPRITDFGIAALLDADGPRLTRDGTGLGTPHYLAPEQVDDARSADARADVFSLGALTYELLTGSPPAEGPVTAVLQRLAAGRWDDPSTRVPGLPGRVDAAIRWAMAPAREERCPSVEAFLERLLEPANLTWAPSEGGLIAEPAVARGRPTTDVEITAAPGTLYGRTALVDALLARLDVRGGAVVLTGPPGVGKSRVAAEVAARFADARGAGAATWIDLSPVDTADAAEQRILAAGPPGGATLGGAFARRGAHLLVLDHADRVLSGLQSPLAAALRSAGSLRVLVTTREATGTLGEERVDLPPLAHDGADARATPGWQILRDAAPAGALDDVPAALARSLLDALDGLPLCLTLAGARLEVLSPAELLERLGSPTRVLRAPGAGGRVDALADALEGSWAAAGPGERRALAALSAFRAPFRLADAEAALGALGVADGLDAVHGLVRRSLLRREAGRFRMLRAIRDFAAGRRGDDDGPVRRAHAAVAVALGQAAVEDGTAAALRSARETVAAELDAVLADAARPEVAPFAADAAAALTALFHDVGPPRALRRVADAGLALAPDDHPGRPRMLVSRALARRRLGDLPGAARDLAAAASHARTDADRLAALVHAADLAIEAGREADARAGWQEALPLARRHGPAHFLVSVATQLATVADDAAEAEALLAEARAAIPADEPVVRLRWAKAAGWLALERGALDEAAARYREARDLAVAIGDDRGETYTTAQLGMVAEAQGALGDAARDLAIAVGRFEEDGDAAYAAFYRGAEGRVWARSGRWDEARARFDAAAADARGFAAPLFLRWGAVVRARTEAVAPPDDDWAWVFAALAARRAGDRAALRAALAGAPPAGRDPDALLLQCLATELATEVGAWRIAADGTQVEDPDGRRIDLSRHAANARILARLLAERRAGDGALDVAALAAAGWPGERILPAAAASRVRVALSALRRAGLEPLVERAGGGWRLRPDAPVGPA